MGFLAWVRNQFCSLPYEGQDQTPCGQTMKDSRETRTVMRLRAQGATRNADRDVQRQAALRSRLNRIPLHDELHSGDC